MNPVHVDTEVNQTVPTPDKWRRADVLEKLDKGEQAALLEYWQAIDKEAAFMPALQQGKELGVHNSCVSILHDNDEDFKNAGNGLRTLVDLADTGIGKKRKERETAAEAVREAALSVLVSLVQIRHYIESGKRDFSNEDSNQAPTAQEIQADEGPGEASTDQQG
jgi:hypothetical protein